MSLNILIALCMAPIIGVVGIAFATGITGWVQYIHHIRVLKDHPQAKLDERFLRNVPKIIGATCAMALALYILAVLLQGWIFGATAFWKIAAIVVITSVGGVVYGAAILGTGALRIKDIKRYLKKKSVTQ